MRIPVIGDRVHYYQGDAFPLPGGGAPLLGFVVDRINNRSINLTVFDRNGATHPRQGVTLLQDADKPPVTGAYCRWPEESPA